MPDTPYVVTLIEKYRSRGALIDANLLLVYLIGKYERKLIPSFARTKQYTVEDFLLLDTLVQWFSTVYTTPNILTEVSNLSGKLPQRLLWQLRDEFVQLIGGLEERYCESRKAVENRYFRKLGLTDAAIISLSNREFLVLTNDFDCWSVLGANQIDAINFNHLRPFGWKHFANLA